MAQPATPAPASTGAPRIVTACAGGRVRAASTLAPALTVFFKLAPGLRHAATSMARFHAKALTSAVA
jgi:hypothetical protein